MFELEASLIVKSTTCSPFYFPPSQSLLPPNSCVAAFGVVGIDNLSSQFSGAESQDQGSRFNFFCKNKFFVLFPSAITTRCCRICVECMIILKKWCSSLIFDVRSTTNTSQGCIKNVRVDRYQKSPKKKLKQVSEKEQKYVPLL